MKRKGNIEFRWSEANQKYELVEWRDASKLRPEGHCFVIAFFDRDREGYSIRSVGRRMLNAMSDDMIQIWRYAEAVLQAEFELTSEE